MFIDLFPTGSTGASNVGERDVCEERTRPRESARERTVCGGEEEGGEGGEMEAGLFRK